jgi:hypothetical protein
MTHKGTQPRVLHLPYQTPYVRKLVHPSIDVVNTKPLNLNGTIPPDLSFRWLRKQESFDFFDVLHIYFIGFDSVEDVHWVLRRCVQEKKRIIYTSHNVTRMYDEDEASYLRKTQVICSFAIASLHSRNPALIHYSNGCNWRDSKIE